jgi:2,2-dialkylglycine decarboxylase (pyruvate)
VSDPLPAAVGCTVLDILLRDRLAERAARLGEQLLSGLLELKKRHACIADVRGRGLLLGVEIDARYGVHKEDPVTRTFNLVYATSDALGTALSDAMLDRGLSANVVRLPGYGGCFRIAPPLTVSEAEITDALRIMAEAFDEIVGGVENNISTA